MKPLLEAHAHAIPALDKHIDSTELRCTDNLDAGSSLTEQLKLLLWSVTLLFQNDPTGECIHREVRARPEVFLGPQLNMLRKVRNLCNQAPAPSLRDSEALALVYMGTKRVDPNRVGFLMSFWGWSLGRAELKFIQVVK